MVNESICKNVVIRCQLCQRQSLLLRRGCIGRHFETAMILSASSNNLCPGSRHMLTRSEDFWARRPQGKNARLRGAGRPDSYKQRFTWGVCQRFTLWILERIYLPRSLTARCGRVIGDPVSAKAISAVPVPAHPSHPCSIQLRLIGEFRNPKSRIKKVNSKESKLE